MFVFNNCSRDARVLKEAKCLVKQGHEVTIHAVWDQTVALYEKRDGFEIVRVTKDPVHYKIARGVKSAVKFVFLLIELFIRLTKQIIKFLLGILLKPIIAVVTFLGLLIIKIFNIKAKRAENVSLKKKILPISRLFPYIKFFFRNKYTALKSFLKNKAKSFESATGKIITMLFMPLHRPLCFIDFYLRCYKLSKKSQADVYHAHDLNTLPVAWLCARRYKKKLVYDSHELYVERNKKHKIMPKFIVKKIESFFLRKVDRVITVSDSIQEELQKRYKINNVTVVLNAPEKITHNESNLSLRNYANINGSKIILYLGNIAFGRGIEKLVVSMQFIEHATLVMMGKVDTNYKLKIIDLSSQFKVDQKIVFLEPVSSEVVSNYAASADIGVVPIENVCLSYYYCLPNKLFENIMAGIPVAGSYFPELKRVIEGYEIGKTFNPDDPKDIAKAINEILTDKESYIKYRKNTEKAAQIYNWENESKKLVNLYKSLELLDDKRGSSSN